jgi:hypothetical protein
MPDPENYANCLQESFEELKAAAMKRPVVAPKVEPVPVAVVPESSAPKKKAKSRKKKPKLTIVSAAE